MKKIFFIGISLLMLIFIFGCAKQPAAPGPQVPADEPVAPPVEVEEPSVEAPVEEAPEPEADPDKPELPDSFKELLGLAAKKVKSYSYFYSGPPNNQGGNTFGVIGDKIKVNITQSDVTLRLPYDTVYLDKTNKYAVGYCFGDATRCPEGPVQYEVDYDEYYEQLPTDWLEIIEYGEVKSSQFIDQRKTKGVMFERGGLKYAVYIDTFSGLPLRTIISEGEDDGMKYHYVDIRINTLKEDDVTPPRGYFE